jgi:hypothetical protein
MSPSLLYAIDNSLPSKAINNDVHLERGFPEETVGLGDSFHECRCQLFCRSKV